MVVKELDWETAGAKKSGSDKSLPLVRLGQLSKSVARILHQVSRHVRCAVDGGLRNREYPLVFVGVGFLRPGIFVFAEANHVGASDHLPVQFEAALAEQYIEIN